MELHRTVSALQSTTDERMGVLHSLCALEAPGRGQQPQQGELQQML